MTLRWGAPTRPRSTVNIPASPRQFFANSGHHEFTSFLAIGAVRPSVTRCPLIWQEQNEVPTISFDGISIRSGPGRIQEREPRQSVTDSGLGKSPLVLDTWVGRFTFSLLPASI